MTTCGTEVDALSGAFGTAAVMKARSTIQPQPSRVRSASTVAQTMQMIGSAFATKSERSIVIPRATTRVTAGDIPTARITR